MSDSVPEGWTRSTVGDIAEVKRGASPRPIQDPRWWGESAGWVRISDVTKSKKYLYKTTNYLSEEGVKKSVKIKKDEVVLSICATIGRPIIVKTDACIHDGFVWFDNLPLDVDREFFYYFLADKENFLSSQRQTGTQGNLNTGIVSELRLPLPPLPEQQKIASILTSVDDVIEKTEAQISKLQNLKQGMMQDLLTNGIGHTVFKDSPVGRIPKSWEVKKLGEIAQLQRGVDITAAGFIEGPYPVVSSSGIAGRHNAFTTEGPGVLVGRKGSIGTVHYVESNYWAHDTSLFVRDFFENDQKYVFYLMTMLDLQRYGTKSGSPSLNRNDIHPLKIACPPKAEQLRISASLMSVDNRLSLLARKNDASSLS